MFNPTALVTEKLCTYLLEKPNLFPNVDFPKNATGFIRVHKHKLKTQGEFSFPCCPDLWRNCCSETGHTLRKDAFAMLRQEEGYVCEEATKKFLDITAQWKFPIERIQIENDRCFLYLQRNVAKTLVLKEVLTNVGYGKLKKDPKLRLWLNYSEQIVQESNELSFYRAKLVGDILKRVVDYSNWTLVTEHDVNEAHEGKGDNVLHLTIASVAGKPLLQPTAIPPSKLNYAAIRTGLVIDPLTGKLTKLKTSEYLSCRSNDMCLMAMHKYGIRIKEDSKFRALMARLGEAAVTVDLMEVRYSSPVQIIRSGKGSTKGAAFILYNSARIESLLRRFEEMVENDDYGPLPALDDVDFNLLDEEEEWQLIFSYIFGFPNLIENCLDQLEKGVCAVHIIVRYLGDFVSLFSVYYRRVRILTQESRQHLMPYVYARIYLVKAVREVLNRTLALLNIEPVDFM